MSEKLRVTFLKTFKEDSPIVATLGIHILSMDMFLSKLKLIRKKDGTFYVAPPSDKYQDPQTGKDVYGNFFWFGEKSSTFFQEEALKAINAYCTSKGITNPTSEPYRAKEYASEPIRSMDQCQPDDGLPF
jgi:hypothetical protein